MRSKSKWEGAIAVLMIVIAGLACNLSQRFKAAQKPAKPCFGGNEVNASDPNERKLLTSEEGGFTVMLPAGFPQPTTPEPVKPGHEYAGRSFYSYNKECTSLVNYTDTTATVASGKGDEAAIAERREFAATNSDHPVTVDREERLTVQNHPAISLYTSSRGINDRPEFKRYEFVAARGRIYEVRFTSEIKEELDHPEVDGFIKSFALFGELENEVISKPEPEFPRIGFPVTKGSVVVEVVVGKDGAVKEAKAVSGPIFLRSSAQQAALKAKFKPSEDERKGFLTYQVGK